MINKNSKNSFKATDGAAIYFFSIISMITISLIFSIIAEPHPDFSVAYRFIMLTASAVMQASNITIFAVYLRKSKACPIYFANKKILRWFYPMGIIFSVLCFAFFYPVASTFEVLLNRIGYKIDSPFRLGAPLENAFIIIIVVFLAPVCEEAVYRSGLLSGLRLCFGDLTAAILCGIAFALMHMNPSQTVFQFFLGFSAALLTLSCGSVLPAVIMHGFNNLYAILCELIPALGSPFNLIEAVFLSSNAGLALSSVVFTTLGVIAMIFLSKRLKACANKAGDADTGLNNCAIKELSFGKQQARIIAIFAAGLGVCAFMWLSQLLSVILQ